MAYKVRLILQDFETIVEKNFYSLIRWNFIILAIKVQSQTNIIFDKAVINPYIQNKLFLF